MAIAFISQRCIYMRLIGNTINLILTLDKGQVQYIYSGCQI